MNTYVVPLTFPDLDSAKRDLPSLLGALDAAGVEAKAVGGGGTGSDDDAGRRDPGPTTRELRVRAASGDEARERLRVVTEGQFPAGMILIGEPTGL